MCPMEGFDNLIDRVLTPSFLVPGQGLVSRCDTHVGFFVEVGMGFDRNTSVG